MYTSVDHFKDTKQGDCKRALFIVSARCRARNENDFRCFAGKKLPGKLAAGDRVIARAHNALNAYLLSCNIVKYLCPLAIGGKGLLADKTAYLTYQRRPLNGGARPTQHQTPNFLAFMKKLKILSSVFEMVDCF